MVLLHFLHSPKWRNSLRRPPSPASREGLGQRSVCRKVPGWNAQWKLSMQNSLDSLQRKGRHLSWATSGGKDQEHPSLTIIERMCNRDMLYLDGCRLEKWPSTQDTKYSYWWNVYLLINHSYSTKSDPAWIPGSRRSKWPQVPFCATHKAENHYNNKRVSSSRLHFLSVYTDMSRHFKQKSYHLEHQQSSSEILHQQPVHLHWYSPYERKTAKNIWTL